MNRCKVCGAETTSFDKVCNNCREVYEQSLSIKESESNQNIVEEVEERVIDAPFGANPIAFEKNPKVQLPPVQKTQPPSSNTVQGNDSLLNTLKDVGITPINVYEYNGEQYDTLKEALMEVLANLTMNIDASSDSVDVDKLYTVSALLKKIDK